jgi:regulator of Ty1 transposition protein 103
VSLQIAVSKAVATTTSAVPSADTEYDKLTDPSKPTPTPPVHAARLSALVKSLASAEGAVSESIKARRGLIEGLEKIIETNRLILSTEETLNQTLTSRKNIIESKKREVEDGIMRGLSADSTPAPHGSPLAGSSSRTNGNNPSTPHEDLERPDIEELTPPPPESLTPAGSPTTINHTAPEMETEQPPAPIPTHPHLPSHTPHQLHPTAGADLLSSLSMPPVRHYPDPSLIPGGGPSKKRKVAAADDYPDFGTGEDALADLDEDVAELLKQESGGAVPDKVYPM